jgi:hypothetical protein
MARGVMWGRFSRGPALERGIIHAQQSESPRYFILLFLLIIRYSNLYLNNIQSRQGCGAAAYKCFFVTANLGGCIFVVVVVVSSNSGAHSGLAREVVAWLLFFVLFSKKVGGVGERK